MDTPIILFDTLHDSFGGVLTEAMSLKILGAPSIYSAAVRGFIKDGVNDFFIDPKETGR